VSTSVTHPNTIQIRPSRLTGLVVGVAILTGVTTWSVSQVTTDTHDGTHPQSEVVSPPLVQSVNAHSPELQAIGISPTAVTRDLVNRGLIPRESLEPAPQSMDAKVQDLVNRGLIPRQSLDD
jgi:hypothetical protein